MHNRWEYLTMQASKGMVFQIDGREFSAKPIDPVLAELGREGWEMCSSNSDGDLSTFLFKRPLGPVRETK